MADAAATTIPMPPEAFHGIESLIELGNEKIKKLAGIQLSEPLTLQLSRLCEQLALQLDCDVSTIRNAIIHALIPLNGLRRGLELEPAAFNEALRRTIALRSTDESKQKHISDWDSIAEDLLPFFQPDNFFSQASKAFDLLVERPAMFRAARILTELRPIYDEKTTKTLAVLQTNTLILRFSESKGYQSIHITLYMEDLETLEAELNRARKKIDICRQEAANAGTNLILFGEAETNDRDK